ncbi:MAG: phosphoribosylaminoimidazole-succinocarboxamide synthase [Planctomycetes bacterium DG_58]|nr:MAG: phosphoribosylaminoimidazole-succinocarboxamide synthase [Planctomycetes bacterium DG_58]
MTDAHRQAQGPEQSRSVVLKTAIRELPVRRGKVRDIYDLGVNLLIVATDRISAFDCVLPTGIPNKGWVLTQLSAFWFDLLHDVTESHLVSAPTGSTEIAHIDPTLGAHASMLAGRTMLVQKAKVLPVECVVRGYLAGSGWRSYRETGEVCGIRLPEGLKESAQLPEPIFTPATKAASGHDENIDFEAMADMLGDERAADVRDRSVTLYEKARDYALSRGVIVCDTKFEWGLSAGKLILIDEALTPDSSRFWPADRYSPGRPQVSFDKQFVRDYLETLDWDKTPPAPELPDEVVRKTSEKYIEAYEKLTGKAFPKA